MVGWGWIGDGQCRIVDGYIYGRDEWADNSVIAGGSVRALGLDAARGVEPRLLKPVVSLHLRVLW